jgi:glycosyltransferase involved in cell wall biosynthesis
LKTIALIDPFYGGHHEVYLKLFSKTLSALGFRIMIFTVKPKEMEKMIRADADIDESMIRYFTAPELVNKDSFFYSLWGLSTGIRRWLAIRNFIKEASAESGWSPDMVFIAWLDSYLSFFTLHKIVDLLFPYDWSGLYFHPKRIRVPESSSIPEVINVHSVLKSSRCKSVAVLDEAVVDKLESSLAGQHVVAFPDVADASPPDHDYPAVRELREKAKGRKIISIVGSIEKRKGILALLEVAKSKAMKDFFFVFAGVLQEGTFENDELELIRIMESAPPDSCYFYFASIAGEPQFNAFVEATDIVYASYNDFYHSSNVLAKAAIFKKSLIVTDGYCMGERVKKFGIGLTVNYGDLLECGNAIRTLCDPAVKKKLAFDFDGYLSAHSPKCLSESFKDLLSSYAM